MTAMGGRRWPAWVRRDGLAYLVALAALIACLGARAAVEPVFAEQTSFLLLVPAVLTGAALGGTGPALFVVLLGLAATEVLTGASAFIHPANLISAAVFGLIGISCGLAGDRLRREHRNRLEAIEGLKTILDTVPDAMFEFDARGALHAFSASAVEQFGWSAEEVAGRPVWILFPPSSHDLIRDCLAPIPADGEPDGFGDRRVLQGRRRDGTVFPMELSVCRKGSAGDRLFTGFARDLSERLAEQRKLQALQADLAHMARLNAMGQMTTTLAHELNQPLTAATNFMSASARLLNRPSPDIPAVTEALRNGVEQTMRAGDIIRRLRAFITKREPHRSSEDIGEVVREAAVLAMAGSYDVTMVWKIEPGLEHILIDRVQIQQVVVNLVRNAREAMAEVEDRTLSISARRAGDMVEISVADTGVGVDPDIAARLLDAFVTSKPHGLGVGLSISRSIVESHGGALWLDAAPERGAVFRFTLSATAGEARVESA